MPEVNINMKLDMKDEKLLFELDFNARAPYSELAKKVGLSKQGTEYKVRNLLKKGVVKGFYPVINVPKLGYFYCRLPLTLQNVNRDKRQEIIKYLIDHPKVFWLFQMQGPWDIFLVIWAKSITEFKDFIEELMGRFGPHIKRKLESIGTDVIHLKHRYLLRTQKTPEIHIKETDERVEIDELDRRILTQLCADARMPLVELAKKIGASAKVIAYRIKRMEQQELILGYRPIINHPAIGYTYYKLFINLNNISKEELGKLKEYVKLNPLVIYLVEAIGFPADLDIEIMVQSNQQLFDFIEDLRFKFPTIIGDYQTVTFIDTLKVRYLP